LSESEKDGDCKKRGLKTVVFTVLGKKAEKLGKGFEKGKKFEPGEKKVQKNVIRIHQKQSGKLKRRKVRRNRKEGGG